MKLSKIIIAIDRSGMDKTLIEYSHFIAKHFETTSAQFIHVVPFLTTPDLFGNQLERLKKRHLVLDELRPKRLEENIHSTFEDMKTVSTHLSVLEGKPQEQLLNTIQLEKPDLLVVGKKAVSDGSGIIAQRIARKADCSVCFVTENANTDLKRILVPIDFSPYSIRALKAALSLKEQLDGVSITALHLIDVPMTAYKINRNRKEIIQRLKERANHSFRQSLADNQLTGAYIEFKTLLNDNYDVAHYIQETAAQEKSDLIITGAKGRSGFGGFVFGSVTERLIAYSAIPPVLVVR